MAWLAEVAGEAYTLPEGLEEWLIMWEEMEATQRVCTAFNPTTLAGVTMESCLELVDQGVVWFMMLLAQAAEEVLYHLKWINAIPIKAVTMKFLSSGPLAGGGGGTGASGFRYSGGGGNGGYGGGGGGGGDTSYHFGLAGKGMGGGGNGSNPGSPGQSGDGRGGAILLWFGTLLVRNSLFINNSAVGGGSSGTNGTQGQGLGGAIFIDPQESGSLNNGACILKTGFIDNVATSGITNWIRWRREGLSFQLSLKPLPPSSLLSGIRIQRYLHKDQPLHSKPIPKSLSHSFSECIANNWERKIEF